MRFALFYHSLISDWNHGNAHFLRGVVRELTARGHAVTVLEPRGGWSRANLRIDQGPRAELEIRAAFPDLEAIEYDPEDLDLDAALADADVVIVHEWTDPTTVARIARRRRQGGRFRLLFHDTHHRALSAADALAALPLDGFDGILAFGESLRRLYLRQGWGRRVWTWHEAADTTVFHPRPGQPREGELIWIGNWGDDERSAELGEFLIEPARRLGLTARVHGVRYPLQARAALAAAGIDFAGWLPNHRVPEAFARFGCTVHIPRRPYVEALPGIPTIRVFEALACGIPLVSAPWRDSEGLFAPGRDFLMARDGREMAAHLDMLRSDPGAAAELAGNGLATIHRRHTCRHRVDELLAICTRLGATATTS